MDPARYAAMSDPFENPNFRRRWDAPPMKAKRQSTFAGVELAEVEFKNDRQHLSNLFGADSQSFLDRLADDARAWRSARYERCVE